MLVGLTIAAALVALPSLCMRDAQKERRRRSEIFGNTLGLFDSGRVTQDAGHFPVLEGYYRQFRIRLEAVSDDMGVRKVPSLWLKATLLVDNQDRGVLDFLVRPQGVETYSPSHDLERRLPVPETWPQHAILCSDSSGRTPDLARLAPHIGAFEDPRMKELLVTPRGIRLVYQAAQGERGEYLVLRRARFALTRLDPRLVKTLLDRAIAVAVDLDKIAEPELQAA